MHDKSKEKEEKEIQRRSTNFSLPTKMLRSIVFASSKDHEFLYMLMPACGHVHSQRVRYMGNSKAHNVGSVKTVYGYQYSAYLGSVFGLRSSILYCYIVA